MKKWLPHWAVEKRGGQDGADAGKEGAFFLRARIQSGAAASRGMSLMPWLAQSRGEDM